MREILTLEDYLRHANRPRRYTCTECGNAYHYKRMASICANTHEILREREKERLGREG